MKHNHSVMDSSACHLSPVITHHHAIRVLVLPEVVNEGEQDVPQVCPGAVGLGGAE